MAVNSACGFTTCGDQIDIQLRKPKGYALFIFTTSTGSPVSKGHFFINGLHINETVRPVDHVFIMRFSCKLQSSMPKERTIGPSPRLTARVQRRLEMRTLATHCRMNASQLAETTGYSQRYIYKQLAKLRKGDPVHDQARSGRPKKISDTTRRRIVRMCKGKRRMSNQ